MKKLFSVFLLIFSISYSSAENLSQKQKEVLYIMNYTHYSAYKIKKYNNILALEDEYNTLSDNLKVEVLNETDKKTVLELMEYITDARIIDLQYNKLQESINARMNGAIYSSIPQVMTVFSGGVTPWALAINAARTAGSMYMNYMGLKNQLGEEFEDKKLELLVGTINNMNNCSKTIFSHTYDIIHEYNIDETWRITDNALDLLLESAKIQDVSLRYKNLKNIIQNNECLQHFPLYWYYLAKAALDNNDYLSAIEHFEKYYDETPSIFLKDEITADAMKGEIVALLNTKYSKSEVLRKLDFIDKNTLAANECRDLYFCGMVANSIGDTDRAFKYLNRSMSRLEAKISNKYLDSSFLSELLDSNTTVYSSDAELLSLVRILLNNIGKETVSNESIRAQYAAGTESFNECLYWYGLQPTDSVFLNLKEKLSDITVHMPSYMLTDTDFSIYIPIQWVINSNTSVILQKLNDKKEIEESLELIIDNKAMKKQLYKNIKDTKIIYISQTSTKDKLLKSASKLYSTVQNFGISTVAYNEFFIKDANYCLVINHPKYPVTLFYNVDRKIKNSDIKPFAVAFNGNTYEFEK